jgi:hypothetical protein
VCVDLTQRRVKYRLVEVAIVADPGAMPGIG